MAIGYGLLAVCYSFVCHWVLLVNLSFCLHQTATLGNMCSMESVKSNKSRKGSQDITGMLEYALCSPASRVGRRLRSEPDLAELFSVGRWHVSKSINELVHRGVLVRRKGSGTYVQQIPDQQAAEPDEWALKEQGVFPEHLFAESANATGQVVAVEPKERYHIGLWGDLSCTTSNNQSLLAHLVARTGQIGHRLSVHSMVERESVPYSLEYMRDSLRANPCDGYLVVARWADLFMQSLGSHSSPILVFADGNYPLCEDAPMVMMDGNAALHRAVSILGKQGFSRIGLIGLIGPGHDDGCEDKAYDSAMAELGLDYRFLVRSEANVTKAMMVTRQMLDSKDRPDAIYVADDYVMVGVREALEVAGVVPGRDIGLITLNTSNGPLLADENLSCIEFDRRFFGGMLIDMLSKAIETKAPMADLITIHGNWKPGTTHLNPARR